MGLIQQLDIIIGGHTFQISAIVLKLEAQGAYPLLLGRPWLWATNIKQNWRKNTLTFQKSKTNIRVSTQEKVGTKKDSMPLYAQSVNMMEGLDEGEVTQYFEENPKIILLYEIDVVDIITPYIVNEEKDTDISDTEARLDDRSLRELCLQQEALERELQVSQRVHA